MQQVPIRYLMNPLYFRIPANITVFAGAFRYASRMATSSDKLVAVVPLSVLQCWNLVRPVLLGDETDLIKKNINLSHV